jgi:tetratricopeptide (TPR) repeat protein
VETLKATASLIPTDVQAVLVARLDRLPLPVKDVVQTAAVLGREFERPILAYMRGGQEPERELEERMVRAEREAVWRALDERRYLFRHVLMRDAAYGMQVHTRLQQIHRQAALAYEALYQTDPAAHYGQIAYHYDQARVVGKALDYYEWAAVQARENYQNEAALAHYGRALALSTAGDVETRYRLLLGQEAVLSWLGRREAQQADLAQLNELAAQLADESKLAETTLRRAALALATGDYETAVTAAQQSAAHAQAARDPLAEARAYHRWGRAHWQQGHVEQGQPLIERALTLARKYHDLLEEAQNLYDLGVIHFYQTKYYEAQISLKQALQLYKTINDKRGEIGARNMFGIVLNAMGDYLDARQQYEHALNLCRQVGWRLGETRILAVLGNNHFTLGSYEIGLAIHKKAIGVCHEIGDKEGEAGSLDTSGLIYHYLNKPYRAKKMFQQAVTIQKSINNFRGMSFTLTHLGYSLIQLDEYQLARDILQEALLICRELRASGLAIDTTAGLALVALAMGNQKESQRLADEILSWIDENGTDGIEFPVQVYLICYRILRKISKENKSLMKIADSALKAGQTLLQDRANRIQDETLRRHFLENVPYNRDLLAAWKSTHSE